MALYKVTQKEIETTERTYDVEASDEREALENYATNKWSNVYPQAAKNTKHTELIIENIL